MVSLCARRQRPARRRSGQDPLRVICRRWRKRRVAAQGCNTLRSCSATASLSGALGHLDDERWRWRCSETDKQRREPRTRLPLVASFSLCSTAAARRARRDARRESPQGLAAAKSWSANRSRMKELAPLGRPRQARLSGFAGLSFRHTAFLASLTTLPDGDAIVRLLAGDLR